MARLDRRRPEELERKPAVRRLDFRAKGTEVCRYRLHRAAPQRRVAVESCWDVRAAASAQEHPCRRARVHAVQRTLRWIKPSRMHDDIVAVRLNPCAKLDQRR